MGKYKVFFKTEEPIISGNIDKPDTERICSLELITEIQRYLKSHADLVNGHISVSGEYWELILKQSYEAINYSCEWKSFVQKLLLKWICTCTFSNEIV